jgi:catechol 2,3-dioxygenase-like lactoylglutathione lyase family enzyme
VAGLPLRICHIAVIVTSLDRSMGFYAALLPLLGFSEESDGIWSDVTGFHFRFVEAVAETLVYSGDAVGMSHVSFTAPDPDLLEEIRHTMAAAGFAVPEVQPLDGCVSLFLVDPDGMRVEITHCGAEPVAGREAGAERPRTDKKRETARMPGLY